jgi:hypothetical protein
LFINRNADAFSHVSLMNRFIAHMLSNMLIAPIVPADPICLFREDWAEIHWALPITQEHVNAAIIGMGTEDVMLDNARILETFTPMTEQELETMHVRMDSFYRSKGLPWMHADYCAGVGGWVAQSSGTTSI